jgi:heat shock 70kDa protein 4
VYEAKAKELRGKGDAILLRFAESSTREPAMQALSNRCQHNLEWCSTSDEKYAHIGEADREVVRAESTATLKWLEGIQKAQAALGKAEPPAVLTADLEKRLAVLEKTCGAVINKPAPPPPKPEAPLMPETADTSNAAGAEAMEEDQLPAKEATAAAGDTNDAAGAGAAAPQPEAMDE